MYIYELSHNLMMIMMMMMTCIHLVGQDSNFVVASINVELNLQQKCSLPIQDHFCTSKQESNIFEVTNITISEIQLTCQLGLCHDDYIVSEVSI